MNGPSLSNVLKLRWRETRSRKGLFASMREIGSDIWQVVLEAMPERRRSLFGDADYDWDHNSNTSSGGVSQRTRLLAAISGAPYQPTEAGLFAEMMNSLDVRFDEFTFVDLGSGKGRTLLMAAELGFRRVIGVELLPELHEVAARNVVHLTNVETICLDARDYEFPDEPLVLYLFNPLPESALENVVAKLRDFQKPLRIIYHNPVSGDVLERATFLHQQSGTEQYVIYSN